MYAFLVEEEIIVVGRIVGPYVFDRLVGLTLVFNFLKVLDHLHGRSAAHSIVYEFVLGSRPGRVFKLGC